MTEPKPDLIAAIASSVRLASTHALDLSFNELMDMWENHELDIQPDYQRLFRWTDERQSRFIESLLLEMPVPPIFVIEEEEGRYLLIDGLQRISSYLHFRGKLSAPHFNPPVEPGHMLELVDCDIVPELNGSTYESLPTALQIRLKRAFIRVEVIRKETDPRFKYHMFKRLNTGGEVLSEQQVRNATIRLLNPRLPEFIITISKTPSFQETLTYLTDERRLSAFDQELVVRFFALKNQRDRFRHGVAEFLTKFMEGIADPERAEPFDYDFEETCFRKTFDVLNAALGEYAFAFANRKRDDLSGGFSIYHFEAITVGLQVILDRISPTDTSEMEQLKNALRTIKLDLEFIRLTTGGGKNSPGPLNDRINFVATRLANAFP